MARGGTALLVIDVQRALFERPLPIYEADHLLDAIDVLVARAHASGASVIYVQHCNKLLAEGSEAWQLHPRLQPRPDDLLVRKRHGSAFQDTPLVEALRERGIANVVVAGLVTHGCIKATVLDAHKRGFVTTVVADAHSSYSKDAAALIQTWNTTFAGLGIVVLPAEAVQF